MTGVLTDQLDWHDATDTGTGERWLATIIVGGTPMHLEARKLDPDSGEFYVWEDDLEHVKALHPGGAMETHSAAQLGLDEHGANGEYLCFSYPHSR